MAKVAIGAPPIVEGVTEEVKSQLSITRKDAIQLNFFSERYLIFAEENHSRKKETISAINSPGSLLGFRCSSTPGVYVRYMTTAIPARLSPIDINKYFLDKNLRGFSCICSSLSAKKTLFLAQWTFNFIPVSKVLCNSK